MEAPPPGVSRRFVRDTPPRVFCIKSVQVIENKRWASKKERKERKRVCKFLKARGLEWERREGSERFVRDVEECIDIRRWVRRARLEILFRSASKFRSASVRLDVGEQPEPR